MKKMQTLDQQYATSILTQVKSVKQKKGYTKYGSMSHTLPILIYTAGLLQALEFVHSREAIQQQLLEDLAQTVAQQDAKAFLQTVRTANLSTYTRLTRHSLAALLWYKRFAQSILDVADGSVEPPEERIDHD